MYIYINRLDVLEKRENWIIIVVVIIIIIIIIIINLYKQLAVEIMKLGPTKIYT